MLNFAKLCPLEQKAPWAAQLNRADVRECLSCEATKRQRFEAEEDWIILKGDIKSFYSDEKGDGENKFHIRLFGVNTLLFPPLDIRTFRSQYGKRKEMWFSLKMRSLFDRFIFPFIKLFDGITTCNNMCQENPRQSHVPPYWRRKRKIQNSFPNLVDSFDIIMTKHYLIESLLCDNSFACC